MSSVLLVLASGWKTARVDVLLFEYGGWVGSGWDINVHVPCVHTWMLRCCYVTGQGKLASAHRWHRWNVENFQRCSIILLEHT